MKIQSLQNFLVCKVCNLYPVSKKGRVGLQSKMGIWSFRSDFNSKPPNFRNLGRRVVHVLRKRSILSRRLPRLEKFCFGLINKPLARLHGHDISERLDVCCKFQLSLELQIGMVFKTLHRQIIKTIGSYIFHLSQKISF